MHAKSRWKIWKSSRMNDAPSGEWPAKLARDSVEWLADSTTNGTNLNK